MYPAALNGTYFIALNANQSMVATAVNGSIFVEPMGSGGQQEWSISPFFFGGNVSSYPILVPPISDSFGGGPGPERLGWVVEPNSTDIGLGGGSNDWIIREVDYINYVYQITLSDGSPPNNVVTITSNNEVVIGNGTTEWKLTLVNGDADRPVSL